MATVALLIWAYSAVGQTKLRPGCLQYEPAVVTLTRTLVRKTFPGPPNYESIRKGDKAETNWFLDLPMAVCVNEDSVEPDLNPDQDAVREIQLVMLKLGQYKQHKTLVGRKVAATGTLSGGITAHHRTAVLLTVRAVEEASK